MARQIINNVPSGSGLGDNLHIAFGKVNAMTEELYSSGSLLASEVDQINTVLQSISDGSLLNHTHTIAQIQNLQTVLDSKVNTSTFNAQNAATATSINNINVALGSIVDILTDLEQNKVPYVSASRDVDLGSRIISANAFYTPWYGGQFIIDARPSVPYLNFSDGRVIDDFTRSIVFNVDVENGIGASYARNGVSSTSVNVKNDFTVYAFEIINSASFQNTFTVLPLQTTTTRKIETGEGFVGNYVQFNTASIETSQVGKLKWNDTDGTLDLSLKGGNVTLQIGQEQLIRVVNKTSPLVDLLEADYQVCVISGATGQRVSVRLAQANNDVNSAGTLGIVTETILRNQEGFITTGGQVKEINTTGALQGETWNDGDVLYLSPTVPGAITNVKPTAPNHTVIVGYVEYAHAVHGKIFVKIDNGYELDELHNVKIGSTPSNSQTLSYNASLGVWENEDELLVQTQRMYNSYRASHNSIMVIGATVGYNLGTGQITRTFTGNDYRKKQRVGVVSLSGSNQSTTYRNATLHFSLDGIEYFEQTFGNAEGMTTPGVRAIHGISTNVGVLTGNIEYNTVTDFIGVCKLSTSNNWHIIHNDNAGLATTVDLGSNFPANVTEEVFTYRVTPKGTNNVDVTFTRHLTGAVTTVNITTNIPSTAVLYSGKGALNNNTSTVAVGFDFFAVTELFK